MNLKPIGSWILVEAVKAPEEKQESVVLLPEDYKKPDNPYTVVRVIEDLVRITGREWKKDDLLLVPTHVIRNILIGTKVFSLIERNHVMAKVEE